MKIEGKNPIRELLASGNSIDKLYVLDGTKDTEIRSWITLAKNMHAKIEYVDKKTLDGLSQTGHHQGIIAESSNFKYAELEDIIDNTEKNKILVLLDGLEDPHNLGSVLRVVECVGADGVIIPSRHSVQVNETVIRVSAGASSYVPVVKVVNLNNAIKQLKESGYWVFGADMDGEVMYNTKLTGNIALVIGAEGKGLSPLTKQLCDQIVSIPMQGKVNSLNASVSAGILLYEAYRQRR